MTGHCTRFALLLVVVLAGCESNSRPVVNHDGRISAADLFTRHYGRSALAAWNVRGTAAGDDCGVLYVATSIIMEDAMVDALHYGAGAYDIYDGGVQSFSRERAFRGVAYRDASGRVWTYGTVSPEEAARLAPCQSP